MPPQMSSQPWSASPSPSSEAKVSRNKNPGGGRQARGGSRGQTACSAVGPSFWFVEAKNAMANLVREAAGLSNQSPPKLPTGRSSKSALSPTLPEQSPARGNVSFDASPSKGDGAKLHDEWADYEYDEDLQEDLFLEREYDEDLQEDVFLERVFNPIPVVNTFIHYKRSPDDKKDWVSSPGKVLQKSFHLKWRNHEEAHNRGECKPCAYYVYKSDGCKWGEDCQFCHLCQRGEIKKRKKKKAVILRDIRQQRRNQAKRENGEPPVSHGEDHPDDVSGSGSCDSQGDN